MTLPDFGYLAVSPHCIPIASLRGAKKLAPCLNDGLHRRRILGGGRHREHTEPALSEHFEHSTVIDLGDDPGLHPMIPVPAKKVPPETRVEPGHEDGPVVEALRKPLPVSARDLVGAHQDDLAVSEEVVVRFDVNRRRERGAGEARQNCILTTMGLGRLELTTSRLSGVLEQDGN